MTTCALIFFGGIGFLTIIGLIKKHSFKLLSLHSKVVLTTSLALIVIGTLVLKMTENVTWLGAFFQSVSARTAGFSTYPIGNFTDAGLFFLACLMFVGASPGSTGGGRAGDDAVDQPRGDAGRPPVHVEPGVELGDVEVDEPAAVGDGVAHRLDDRQRHT